MFYNLSKKNGLEHKYACFRRDLVEIVNNNSCKNSELQNIYITSEAFDKANKISKRIIENTGNENEIIFYLVNFKNKTGREVIRDIFIPKQHVTWKPIR